MAFLAAMGLFLFIAGIFACCLVNSRHNEDLFMVLLLFTGLAAVAFGSVVGDKPNKLIARQYLLEQKCIQAGLATMKSVATEERFEFIEVSPALAEKNEP